MILKAIAVGKTLDVISSKTHPTQMILIIELNGYVHAAPCEKRGDTWRIITAYPSRKYHKHYLS